MRALALIALIMPVASFAAKNTLWSDVIDAGRYVSPKGYNMQQALLRDFCAMTQDSRNCMNLFAAVAFNATYARDAAECWKDEAKAKTQECKDALDYNRLIMSDYNAATDDMKHQEDKANGY